LSTGSDFFFGSSSSIFSSGSLPSLPEPQPIKSDATEEVVEPKKKIPRKKKTPVDDDED